MITKSSAEKILDALSAFYGPVVPGLTFHNVYQLTVSVVLSAQTTDRQVNLVTPELFSRYPDFKSLAEADTADVERIIKSTGFYHTKAKNIIGLSKKITEDYGGEAPATMEELTSLPGVGRKSANVILSMGYNIPGLAVDTHVSRIAHRLGFTDVRDPLKAEKALTEVISPERWKEAHLLLISHGRKTCDARKPACPGCPLKKYCSYYKNLL